MNLLPFQQASQIPAQTDESTRWLIEGLWSDQAVGILGGEPKCCKSFLALDVAVSVASGTPCLRHYPVAQPGPVLLFPGEDALGSVRRRLEGISAAASVDFSALAVNVITAPVLRLDTQAHCQLLSQTLAQLKPRLLILDPLIRLHRLDENDATQIASLLSFLRELQRQFKMAVMLVHHARKDSHASRPGQALRGTSELHGWGDSNLYLRRQGKNLTLTIEHRAAPSPDPIPLQLTQDGPALALHLLNPGNQPKPGSPPPPMQTTPVRKLTPIHKVYQALAQLPQPASVRQIRQHCGLRSSTVCSLLHRLLEQKIVTREARGYSLVRPQHGVSLPKDPIPPPGNGNGNRTLSQTPISCGG